MKTHSLQRLLIIAAVMALPHPCSAADTVPPSFSWMWPEPFTVLTTDSPRLCVDPADEGSGVAEVRYYARYFDHRGRAVEHEFAGEVSAPPWEIIWDCSHIPDQNFGKLVFFCEVEDRAGNIAVRDVNGSDRMTSLVLDRNHEYSDERLVSHYTKKAMLVDGRLDEWASTDSVLITNNDNRVTVYSQWDRDRLYFAVIARGRSVISHYTPEGSSIEGMSLEDVVEIFLDPDHSHDRIFQYPDRHFLIAAGGLYFERKEFFDENGAYVSELVRDPGIDVQVVVEGTLNDDTDTDTGYTMEIAIPWDDLGREPGNGATLGLEIWNNDKDFVDGNYYYAGWTTTAANLNNPSEWGNLVCVGGEDMSGAFLSGLFLLLAAVGGGAAAYYASRKRKAPAQRTAHSEARVEESEHIRKAKEYIAGNFTEETLSREDVAGAVGLTPSYFGKVFKKETGRSFTDYLAEVRIAHARELLESTQKNISEIALDAGFSSQSYFGYLFKKKLNLSPKDYRVRVRGGDAPEIE